jgi:hypothetical protein
LRHEYSLPPRIRCVGGIGDRRPYVVRVSLAHAAPSGSGQASIGRKDQAAKAVQAIHREASKLYADALVHDQAEVSALVSVYALISRMRVVSSSPVIEKAEAVVHLIIDTYFTPNKTFSEVRELMNGRAINPLRAFSEECRAELHALNDR